MGRFYSQKKLSDTRFLSGSSLLWRLELAVRFFGKPGTLQKEMAATGHRGAGAGRNPSPALFAEYANQLCSDSKLQHGAVSVP
jgi:hypothetical protein